MSATPPPFNPQVQRPVGPVKKGANPLLILLAVMVGFCCILIICVTMMARQMIGPIASTAE
ncbi:MAG: hypothetical protein ABUL49_01865, partial [bacterium]